MGQRERSGLVLGVCCGLPGYLVGVGLPGLEVGWVAAPRNLRTIHGGAELGPFVSFS